MTVLGVNHECKGWNFCKPQQVCSCCLGYWSSLPVTTFFSFTKPAACHLQAKESAFDVGAWETYGDHWRYFFECMLAPMASQAQSALEKLPVTATPRASIDTPTNFIASVMKSWTSMVAEITAGSKEAKGGYKAVPARLFAYALAPQHGPVIRTSLSHLSAEYRKWTQEQVSRDRSVNSSYTQDAWLLDVE